MEDGGRAFPVSDTAADMPGMSLRDYFAAHIAIGAATAGKPKVPENWARHIYKLADALLVERERKDG